MRVPGIFIVSNPEETDISGILLPECRSVPGFMRVCGYSGRMIRECPGRISTFSISRKSHSLYSFPSCRSIRISFPCIPAEINFQISALATGFPLLFFHPVASQFRSQPFSIAAFICALSVTIVIWSPCRVLASALAAAAAVRRFALASFKHPTSTSVRMPPATRDSITYPYLAVAFRGPAI